MSETVVVGLAAIVIIGVAAQWLAAAIRIPSIILLLGAGLAAGPVLGLLDPDELFGDLLAPFVSLAVGTILFEGGLSLRIRELEGVAGPTWRLVSVGALITWITLTGAAVLLLRLPGGVAALLGAVLVVTGPTVIAPMLRQIRPTRRVAAILKWEGILIDAIGAMLAVIVFETIIQGQETRTLGEAVTEIGIFLAVGAGVGAAVAAVMIPLLRRFRIPEFLHSGVSLALALAAFTIANLIREESGLLATIVLGMALANQRFVSVRSIVEFSETIRVLLVAVLFIVLSARIEFSELVALGFGGVVLLVVAIGFTRPLAVWVSALGSGLSQPERTFLAFVAPRGIVAVSISAVFAAELTEAGVEGAETLVPAAFLVILGTALFYGLGAAPLGRRLGVARPDPHGVLIVGADRVARAIAGGLDAAGVDVTLVSTNRPEDYEARMSGLKTRYTSILNDQIDESMLEDISLMLALTINDEYNSLACLRMSEHLGLGATFQLRPLKGPGTPKAKAPPQLRGRLIFGGDLDHSVLDAKLAEGYEVRATTLSKSFDFKAYHEKYEHKPALLFLVDPEGRVSPYTVDGDPKRTPGAGEKIVGILPPDRKERPREREARARAG